LAVPVGMPDHALLTRARDGDGEAFEALYRRHHRAAARAAHSYSSRTQLAEDAVQEAFMRILQATQEGGGPKTEFRAYLATTVRHVIAGWTRGERTILTDELEKLAGEDTRDSNRPESRLRWQLLTKAFKSLPTRWQEALWLGEVEGVAPAELAERWNMSANSAAALSYRAREGLRTAWLDAHVNEGLVPDECRPFVTDLSRYTQGKLTDRRENQVRSHLEDCDYCRGVLFEVDTAASELRVLLIPVAAWAGLALAGGGAASGSLAGLVKLAGGLGARGMALGATSTAAITAIVVVAVTMNPGIADAFGTDTGAARPLVTLGPAGGTDPGHADDDTDDTDDPDADADADADEPSEDPSEDPTDGPSDDPAAVPTPDAGDTTSTQRVTSRDDPPSSTDETADPGPTPSSGPMASPDPTPSPDPTTPPPTIPPVVPPTTEPEEPATEPLAVLTLETDVDLAAGIITFSGNGEPGASVTVAGDGIETAPTTVDDAGSWVIEIPATPNLSCITVVATQTLGDRTSQSPEATIPPIEAPLATLTLTATLEGDTIVLRGDGEPGASVTVTGDGMETAPTTVDDDGSWVTEIPADPAFSGIAVIATQTLGDRTSQSDQEVLPDIEVSGEPEPPNAPIVLDLAIYLGESVTLAGLAQPGAEIEVRMVGGDDVWRSHADAILPTWSIGFWDERIANGGLTVVVVQIVNGVESVPSDEIVLSTATARLD